MPVFKLAVDMVERVSLEVAANTIEDAKEYAEKIVPDGNVVMAESHEVSIRDRPRPATGGVYPTTNMNGGAFS